MTSYPVTRYVKQTLGRIKTHILQDLPIYPYTFKLTNYHAQNYEVENTLCVCI